jgi:hypothetical protein
MARKKLGREDISPEDIVFAKGDLKVHGISMMALSRKHCHGVMENVASTLNTLVQPVSSMALLVDSNRKRLASTVIYCVDEGNVKLVGMFRKVVSG